MQPGFGNSKQILFKKKKAIYNEKGKSISEEKTINPYLNWSCQSSRRQSKSVTNARLVALLVATAATSGPAVARRKEELKSEERVAEIGGRRRWS